MKVSEVLKIMNDPIYLGARVAASYTWNTCQSNFITKIAKTAAAFVRGVFNRFSVSVVDARQYVNRSDTKNTHARSILDRKTQMIDAGNTKISEMKGKTGNKTGLPDDGRGKTTNSESSDTSASSRPDSVMAGGKTGGASSPDCTSVNPNDTGSDKLHQLLNPLPMDENIRAGLTFDNIKNLFERMADGSIPRSLSDFG